MHEIVNQNQVLKCDANLGPTYGGGPDIYITSECNEESCFSNFGHSYYSPYKIGSETAKNYLGGS